jgi:AAA lid domain-containing protein
MSSRVAHHLDFAAYELDEVTAIGRLMLDQSRYYLSEDAEEAFRQYLSSQMDQPLFANARSVRNELERARLRHAHRLASDLHRNWTRDDLIRLEPADILDGHADLLLERNKLEGTRAAGQVLGCARGPTGRQDGCRPGRRTAPDRRIRGVQDVDS